MTQNISSKIQKIKIHSKIARHSIIRRLLTRQKKSNKYYLLSLKKKINSKQINKTILKQKLNCQNYIQPIDTQEEIQKQCDQSMGFITQQIQNKELEPVNYRNSQKQNSKYYISNVLENYRQHKSLIRQHLKTSLLILKSFQSTNIPSQLQINDKLVKILPTNKQKTIVLDLDQTLIHCQENTVYESYDLMFQLEINQKFKQNIAINIRPGAIQFLKKLSKHYEIIIFTASTKVYADKIIDYLDSNNQLINYRLYRQNCIMRNGFYVKDLRILGRCLKNVLLVDNAAYSYVNQIENGVPIIPYFKGKEDRQLQLLGNYLLDLKNCSQIRKYNNKYFKLHKYSEFEGKIEQLVEKLYQ